MSGLLLLETLVMPIRQTNKALINRYETLLTASEINLIPITRSILKSAANIRATANIKTPDAIHAATAIDVECTIFLTNDKVFLQIPELPTVILQDVLHS